MARNDTGVTAPVGNTGCFLYQRLGSEECQCDGQKNQSSSEETKAHAASELLPFGTDKEACAKYDKEQSKQDRRGSPNSGMCPYIQSTSEEKDKAQPDTDHAVSLGHRAEFSTPQTGRQSKKPGTDYTKQQNGYGRVVSWLPTAIVKF